MRISHDFKAEAQAKGGRRERGRKRKERDFAGQDPASHALTGREEEERGGGACLSRIYFLVLAVGKPSHITS